MFLKKIDEHLNDSLAAAGFANASSLQKKSIGQIKSGGNIVIAAPEGAGKTTTIVISVIQLLKAELDDVPRAVIVVRDKAAALHLKEQFDLLGKRTNLRVHCLYDEGKLDIQKDMVYLGSDIIIGTPARLNKLYSANGLNLNGLRIFVLINASLLMRQTLPEQIDRLARSLPKTQLVVTTQELNYKVERFADLFMEFPQILEFDEVEVMEKVEVTGELSEEFIAGYSAIDEFGEDFDLS